MRVDSSAAFLALSGIARRCAGASAGMTEALAAIAGVAGADDACVSIPRAPVTGSGCADSSRFFRRAASRAKGCADLSRAAVATAGVAAGVARDAVRTRVHGCVLLLAAAVQPLRTPSGTPNIDRASAACASCAARPGWAARLLAALTSVLDCPSARVLDCPSTRVLGCPSARVLGCLGARACPRSREVRADAALAPPSSAVEGAAAGPLAVCGASPPMPKAQPSQPPSSAMVSSCRARARACSFTCVPYMLPVGPSALAVACAVWAVRSPTAAPPTAPLRERAGGRRWAWRCASSVSRARRSELRVCSASALSGSSSSAARSSSIRPPKRLPKLPPWPTPGLRRASTSLPPPPPGWVSGARDVGRASPRSFRASRSRAASRSS